VTLNLSFHTNNNAIADSIPVNATAPIRGLSSSMLDLFASTQVRPTSSENSVSILKDAHIEQHVSIDSTQVSANEKDTNRVPQGKERQEESSSLKARPYSSSPPPDPPRYPAQKDYRCALLFFGLPRRYQSIALPSIYKNIIGPNPDCDVYVHTYNISELTTPFSQEYNSPIVPNEVYLLTDNVIMDNAQDFEALYNLSFYRQYLPPTWGPCCASMDNMIKQWHSLKRVWSFMEEKGMQKQRNQIHLGLLPNSTMTRPFYHRVGLFRSDLFYLHPIDITDSDAAIADFAHFGGRNDRMFYGLYKYAQIWATKRFEFANIYIANYMNRFLLHSERMVGRLLEYYHIPYELKKICFLRMRAGTNLRVARDECGFPGVRSVEESSSDLWWKEILRLLPHDYYQIP